MWLLWVKSNSAWLLCLLHKIYLFLNIKNAVIHAASLPYDKWSLFFIIKTLKFYRNKSQKRNGPTFGNWTFLKMSKMEKSEIKISEKVNLLENAANSKKIPQNVAV